ncbi:hypothetical protein JKP88DRAFT_333800 [Tribonema minus]|uniref:FYVE-type domain-containing protein n=1 Tax=Tribonema minus TaxID=303371 RepID=A0A835YKQ1_9STRA|nr:hypothetical protein JKP88DRAFT_333800 [Tribonema minus]
MDLFGEVQGPQYGSSSKRSPLEDSQDDNLFLSAMAFPSSQHPSSPYGEGDEQNVFAGGDPLRDMGQNMGRSVNDPAPSEPGHIFDQQELMGSYVQPQASPLDASSAALEAQVLLTGNELLRRSDGFLEESGVFMDSNNIMQHQDLAADDGSGILGYQFQAQDTGGSFMQGSAQDMHAAGAASGYWGGAQLHTSQYVTGGEYVSGEYTRQTVPQAAVKQPPHSLQGSMHAADPRLSLSAYRPLSQVHQFQVHTFTKPTFCNSCGKLLMGFTNQGVCCTKCEMAVHAACQHALCTADHKCFHAAALKVTLTDGVPLGEQVPELSGASAALNPPLPLAHSRSEDPTHSDWHKHLLRSCEMRVPDRTALACMVCSAMFNIVRRRHHCRRCGACVCGACSAVKVSDKVMVQDFSGGPVRYVKETEPVRTCTRCTRVVDEALARALSKRVGGGRKHGPGAGGHYMGATGGGIRRGSSGFDPSTGLGYSPAFRAPAGGGVGGQGGSGGRGQVWAQVQRAQQQPAMASLKATGQASPVGERAVL